MPTYEYHCKKCKKKYDVFQRITEKPLTKCARCGAAKPERLISSGAGLIFKGTGFYITDYKRKGAGGEASKAAPKKSDSAASKGAGTSSDA